jgi:hypothetical protein
VVEETENPLGNKEYEDNDANDLMAIVVILAL